MTHTHEFPASVLEGTDVSCPVEVPVYDYRERVGDHQEPVGTANLWEEGTRIVATTDVDFPGVPPALWHSTEMSLDLNDPEAQPVRGRKTVILVFR